MHEEYSRFISNYSFIEALSSGTYGKTYVATNKLSGSKHAVKFIKRKIRDNRSEDKALNEIKIMDGLKHENIVNLKQCWIEQHTKEWMAEKDVCDFNQVSGDVEVYSPVNRGDTYLFIAMEYCENGNLNVWLEKNRETASRLTLIIMMQQLVRGLDYLHSKMIIHRDLKPENIFIDHENIVKIGDLGSARFMNEETAPYDESGNSINNLATYTKNTGTPLYMSPEQRRGLYNEKVDIFALGLVFMKVFIPNLSQEQLKLVHQGKFPEDLLKENDLLELIKTMIEVDSLVRISAKDLYLSLHGLQYRLSLPKNERTAELDAKQPFPYRNDNNFGFNRFMNERSLKSFVEFGDKFVESLTEEEKNSSMNLMKCEHNKNFDYAMLYPRELFPPLMLAIHTFLNDPNSDFLQSQIEAVKDAADRFNELVYEQLTLNNK